MVEEIDRVRRLEILQGADPSEHEVFLIWKSYAPERDENFDDFQELWRIGAIEEIHFPLWRAKMRYDLGYLTGLMDALVICRHENLPLPQWASEAAHRNLAFTSTECLAERPTRFSRELTRLKELVHSKLVLDLVSCSRRVPKFYLYIIDADVLDFVERRPVDPNIPNTPELDAALERGRQFQDRLLPPYRLQPHVEEAVAREGFDPYPERLSLQRAFEIVSIGMRGHWARGTPGTIKKNFSKHLAASDAALAGRPMTAAQLDALTFDLEMITPETMNALGIMPYDQQRALILN